MPKKPTKWGIKAWVLAGSKSGFVFNWKLYTGKENDQVEKDLGKTVVLTLCDVLQQGHEVYFDNFFCSADLLNALAEKGLGGCGTVRANRVGNPQEIKAFAATKNKKKLQDMSPIFLRSEKILAIGWYDKRPVTMLTTVHTSGISEKRIRDGNTPDGYRVIQKPVAIEAYNQSMGGVDNSDQLNSYNNMVRKSMKWWKKVFFHLVVTSLSNAYVLYRKHVPVVQQKKADKFRLNVAKGLLEGYERQNSKPGRRSTQDNPMRLTGRHFIEKVPSGKPDCVVCCKKEGKKYVRRKQTTWRCKQCFPHIALCQIPCFEIYHTINDFKGHYEANFV
jgi:hypothetical protein